MILAYFSTSSGVVRKIYSNSTRFFSRFFFQMFWKDGLSKKIGLDVWSFLYYQERWYFFFPKISSYSLDKKWKMIFLKKNMEIWYFLQMFWKDGLSIKLHWNMTFVVLSTKIIFLFPENMILFFRRKMKDDLSQKNTWKYNIFFKCPEKVVFP